MPFITFRKTNKKLSMNKKNGFPIGKPFFLFIESFLFVFLNVMKGIFGKSFYN